MNLSEMKPDLPTADRPLLITMIEQELDFIGQLYVEYEQITTYPDALTHPDQLRSLASLFYDFMDRLQHIVRSAEEENPNAELASLLGPNTMRRLKPFLEHYRRYSEFYPDNIDADRIVQLYELFPDAAEQVAGELRRWLENRGESNAR